MSPIVANTPVYTYSKIIVSNKSIVISLSSSLEFYIYFLIFRHQLQNNWLLVIYGRD